MFCEHILEHHRIQGQVHDQPFELRVLLLELLELADLLGFQSGIAPFPPVEGLLGNPQMTDQIGDWGSHLRLFEHGTICSTLKRVRFTASSSPFRG